MRARRAETAERRDNGSIVVPARRRLGAVGHSCIVPYGARSPARSAAEGHAQNLQSNPLPLQQKPMTNSTDPNDDRS